MSQTPKDFAESLFGEIRKKRSSPAYGTIIRFVARADSGSDYTYVAIFVTGKGWYTTDKIHRWPTVIPHHEMVEILSGNNVQKVEVATAFYTLFDNTSLPF